MSGQPPTRYAKSGEVNVAYQVLGDAERDLVLAPGWLTHIEIAWEEPRFARFLEGLAGFRRVILFDKRGTGMSDPVAGVPTLEERMDDIRAVMDAAGSERAALMGYSEGGPLCMLFSATYPERSTALILYASLARAMQDPPDYPWGWSQEFFEAMLDAIEAGFAGAELPDPSNPSVAEDERYQRWFRRYLRMSATPGTARALMVMNAEIDVREVLPTIRVPTLVMHRTGEQWVEPGHSRYLAEHIPGARLVELPGADHWPYIGDSAAVLGEIEEFLTGVRHEPAPERALATVLFTDIVGSTERAAALGDTVWRELLAAHDVAVRSELERFDGREVKHTGDGFLAAFDGPARAVRCAQAIAAEVRELGVEVRAGIHTGECEIRGHDLGGMAVHIGARIGALAGPGEVLVSSTVRDLVVGSGIDFADRGVRSLKGVPGDWTVLAAEPGVAS